MKNNTTNNLSNSYPFPLNENTKKLQNQENNVFLSKKSEY